MYVGDASWLATAGRLLLVAFFLAVGIRNLQRHHIDDHVKRLTNFKAPFPRRHVLDSARRWNSSAARWCCSIGMRAGCAPDFTRNADHSPARYCPVHAACWCHRRVLGTEKVVQVAGQVELVHPAAVRANIRSILVAMMKSFSCSPLIFLVCSETVALPQPKLIFG